MVINGACRSRDRLSSATLTIVVSRTAMMSPTVATPATTSVARSSPLEFAPRTPQSVRDRSSSARRASRPRVEVLDAGGGGGEEDGQEGDGGGFEGDGERDRGSVAVLLEAEQAA